MGYFDAVVYHRQAVRLLVTGSAADVMMIIGSWALRSAAGSKPLSIMLA